MRRATSTCVHLLVLVQRVQACQRAVSAVRRAAGPASAQCAAALAELGSAYGDLGLFTEQAAALETALNTVRALGGTEPRAETVHVLTAVSEAYRRLRENEKCVEAAKVGGLARPPCFAGRHALRYAQEALREARRVYSPKVPLQLCTTFVHCSVRCSIWKSLGAFTTWPSATVMCWGSTNSR